MDSSGFSSPRLDIFPAGLRVLVVDDDPTWLKILEKMLKKCNYEVTICNLARDALDLLRERRDGFDIVISDVNMPDMDGFKLLEHVGLEMDLPVIMMSVDGETSRVMKGVQHGACDYLLKPIRMKELRNIWQHVFRKRVHEMRDVEGYESLEEIQMMRSGTELSDGDSVSGKKRKDAENKHIDGVCGDSSSVKKARVFWTVELHQKFVKAVNQIGFEKVGPKKVLDLMGEPWLTRENVASHLQKYRLYLIRLQKENELKATFGGTKRSDISSKDFSGDVCLQNSITKNPTTVQQNILIHNDEPKTETNVKWTTFSMSMADSKKGALLGDTNDLAKSSKTRIGYDHSFDLSDSDVQSEPKIQAQYSWSAGVPPLQFKQENKPGFHSENGFDHLPMPIHHIQIDPAQTSPVRNATTQDKESDEPTQARFKPSYSKNTSQDINKLTKTESTAALFPVQYESHLTDCHSVDSIPSSMWNSENLSLEQNLFDVPKYSQRNLVLETGSGIKLWDEGFANYSSQVDIYPPNAHLGSFDLLSYDNQDLVSDIPPYLYDILKFDPEFPSDTVEYPMMEQGCVHSMRLSMY